ncbi:uncharacterized protein [Nicotiana tomentosiformis]|uniref:uncharacterized protein n=1 Tax=Nicotiana tomentosiformis TaxID=4098 RepID=UPI00388CC087
MVLYLSVLDGAFGCVLGEHDETERKEQAIYYLSKKFTPYEARGIIRIGEDITETYDGWRMFFDGATNFKGVGIGEVLVLETSQHYPELLVIGDSDILVHQVLGEWATKNIKIFPYLYYVQELMKRFRKIEFKHVPRIQNEFAAALATQSSMIQHPDKNFIDPIPVGIHNQPAYCAHVEEEIDGNPWIKHKNSTTYRPQMNGVVEATNKNNKKILRKMVDNHKQWHEKLPFALLGYRTMVRTSTGATLYLLVYGTEVVIPAEVEIPSLRIIQEAKLNDAE